jgi:hypothetical protein
LRADFESVGCFARAPNDLDDAHVYHDRTCVRAGHSDAGEPCRSGLPFFRLRLEEGQSHLDCSSFCLSKGLDLSGVVARRASGDELECRCGATAGNLVAWHEKAAPHGLLLPSATLPPEHARCEILVWRYTGPLSGGSVPYSRLQLSIDDVAYLDEVADGADHVDEEDSPGSAGDLHDIQVDTVSSEGHLRDIQGFRSCYPSNCGPGRGPWLTKNSSDGLVYVNYYFTASVDQERKEAFQLAIDEWEQKTCIRFVPSHQTPRVEVRVGEPDSCSASLGWPGSTGTAVVNLGWCNSVRQVGAMIHELGHTTGMSHEQKRLDAAEQLQTPEGVKGPYLRVLWNNIEDRWFGQFTPDSSAYIGSAASGYAEYDYSSVMHYGSGSSSSPRFETVNPVFESVVGSRSGLSKGDVEQILDMYQCSAPAPTPAPAFCSGAVDDTTFQGPLGLGCDGWRELVRKGNRCEDWDQEAQNRCPVACGVCPAPTASPTRAPTQAPTPAPTPASTPTLAPTSAPTPFPTPAPTQAPTPAPTPAPTSPPTPSPTPSPTPLPASSTTQAPTVGACADDPAYRGPWDESCDDWRRLVQGGQSCEAWGQQAQHWCPVACGVCPTQAATSVSAAA